MKILIAVFVALTLLNSCEHELDKVKERMDEYGVMFDFESVKFQSPVPTPIPVPTNTCNPNCPTAEPSEPYIDPGPQPYPTVEPSEE